MLLRSSFARAYPILKHHNHTVAHIFSDELAQFFLHRQLVPATAQRHK